MKKLKASLLLSSLVLSGAALAQAKPPASDWTVTGNASLNSDYRFRGFTQTNYGPAFQGGIDIAHSSGFYVGNWNSNVKDTLFNGASLEMDFYGGYKGEFSGIGYDLGAIYYYYPKSGKDAAFTGVSNKIDNKEIYAGLSWGPVSGKLYYSLGDYFKIAEMANALFGTATPSTKGTTYLDLSFSQDFGGIVLGAHYGLLTVKNRTPALTQTVDVGGNPIPKSVGDYKLSVGKDVGGYMFTAAAVGTTRKGYFGTDLAAAKAAGKNGLVLSVAKTF